MLVVSSNRALKLMIRRRSCILDLGELFFQRCHGLQKRYEATFPCRLDNETIAVAMHDRVIARQLDSTGMQTAWLRPLRNNLTGRLSMPWLQHMPQTYADEDGLASTADASVIAALRPQAAAARR